MADRKLKAEDHALAAELHEPIGRLYWIQGMCMRPLLRTLSAADGSEQPPTDAEAAAIAKRTLSQASQFLKHVGNSARLERGNEEPLPGELAHDILM